MNVPLSRLFHNRVARSVRPDVFSQRRDEVRSIFRRSREVVLLAAATGIATGLFVRGLDVAVHAVYDRLFEAPLWMLLTAPVSGLLVAALSLRYIGGGISGSTSDEYLQSFHDSQYRLGLRALVARSIAAIASLGTGGSLGLEEIMQDLRKGIFDVLIGVNLLREGLDLPEVSLVAILDADKEGFLRSHRSLTQTIGRAARNVSGVAIMYADKITKSMQLTIDETNKRREKQISYNKKNKITPTQINKKIDETLSRKAVASYQYNNAIKEVAEQDLQYLAKSEIEKRIREKRKQMEKAAKSLDFIIAAQLRDEITILKQQLKII